MLDKLFELKDEHIKLITSSYISWNEGYNSFGAPTIDLKRPYGNSDVEGDVHYILSGEQLEGELDFITLNHYKQLHKETETALQIILRNKSFETGVYKYTFIGDKWEKIG